MKGLDIGRVYIRRGTINDEAVGKEVIDIQRWFDSLPSFAEANTLNEAEVLIERLANRNELISTILISIRSFAKQNALSELFEFSQSELNGYDVDRKTKGMPEIMNHRMVTTLISPHRIELPPYFGYNSSQTYEYLKNSEDFDELNMIWPDSILRLEKHINEVNENSVIATLSSQASKIFPNWGGKDLSMNTFLKPNSFEKIYEKIRIKLTEELLKVC